jgi:hypothetical protein
MLAKRPESVSLNWSLQSRAKRAIKKIFIVETNSIRKQELRIPISTNQENSYLFPENSLLLRRHKEADACRLEGNVHFRKLKIGDSSGFEGSGIDRKGRRSGY